MFILSLRACAAFFLVVCLVLWCLVCPIHVGATLTSLDQGVYLVDWLDLSMNLLCAVVPVCRATVGFFPLL